VGVNRIGAAVVAGMDEFVRGGAWGTGEDAESGAAGVEQGRKFFLAIVDPADAEGGGKGGYGGASAMKWATSAGWGKTADRYELWERPHRDDDVGD